MTPRKNLGPLYRFDIPQQDYILALMDEDLNILEQRLRRYKGYVKLGKQGAPQSVIDWYKQEIDQMSKKLKINNDIKAVLLA